MCGDGGRDLPGAGALHFMCFGIVQACDEVVKGGRHMVARISLGSTCKRLRVAGRAGGHLPL